MAASFSFHIPIPPLFSFAECLWYLDRGYDDCLYTLAENEIQKAVDFEGQFILFSVKEKQGYLEVRILKGEFSDAVTDFLIHYIKDWFDLDRDIRPFYARLQNDNVLAYMVESFYGLRLVGIVDLFEALCWSIIGQQINLTFAYRLKRRLVERFGTHLEYEGKVHLLFPSPSVLATVSIQDLKAMQFSTQKADYLIGLAGDFENGKLSKQMLVESSTFLDKQKKLTEKKGIGIWTANYVLMKCLRESGSIPYGDAGLLNALLQHAIIDDKKQLAKLEAFFQRYKGCESYVVFYLWRSLAVKKKA